jgi:alkyl hydroperoxide reductase subunit AhpC
VVKEGVILPAPLTASSLLQNDYALLLFYPLNFTFVCPTELTAFADRIEEFKAEKCAVFGVSVDSEYSHLQWMKQSRQEGGLFSEQTGKLMCKGVKVLLFYYLLNYMHTYIHCTNTTY